MSASVPTPTRPRGVALATLLAGLDPARRDFARRVYVALRARKLPRDLAADLAGRACAAADAGSDLPSIAAELRIPVGRLTAESPVPASGADVASASPTAPAHSMAAAPVGARMRTARVARRRACDARRSAS